MGWQQNQASSPPWKSPPLGMGCEVVLEAGRRVLNNELPYGLVMNEQLGADFGAGASLWYWWTLP